MTAPFCITYEQWSAAALEAGDTDDRGWLAEDVSLRDALDALAADLPPHAWLQGIESDAWRDDTRATLINIDWADGAGGHITRTVHLPADATPSTRARIVRAVRNAV